jgi:hypothetical protein
MQMHFICVYRRRSGGHFPLLYGSGQRLTFYKLCTSVSPENDRTAKPSDLI